MNETNPSTNALPTRSAPPQPEAPPPPWFVGGLVAMVLIVAVVALTPIVVQMAAPRFNCRQISTAISAHTSMEPHRAK